MTWGRSSSPAPAEVLASQAQHPFGANFRGTKYSDSSPSRGRFVLRNRGGDGTDVPVRGFRAEPFRP